MIALKLPEVRVFMNKLLCTDTFDNFLLQEANICGCISYHIEGALHKDFFSEEELKIENIKSEIIDNLNKISDKKATLNGLSTMIANIQNRKSQVMKELADITYENDKINMQIEDINEDERLSKELEIKLLDLLIYVPIK